MSIPICTETSTIRCPHGGTATVPLPTSNTLTQIEGALVLLETDVHPVAGCKFTLPGPTRSPCMTIRWSAGATQTRVDDIPVLLQNSVGICYSAAQAPQGTAIVEQVQSVAKGI